MNSGGRAVIAALALCIVIVLAASDSPAQSASTNEIVSRVAQYIDEFVGRFVNVVAEERYLQETTTPRRRRELISDFLFVKPQESKDWYQFRDVLEVDGTAVRDRDERLAELFLEGSPVTAIPAARRIAEEGARYNLVEIGTVNQPLLGLAFLQKRYQARFRFSPGPRENDIDSDVRLISFHEWAVPTILRDNAAANLPLPVRGRAWIEESTGRVVKTEVLLGEGSFPMQIVTTFQFDDRLKMDVPVEMRDWYPLQSGELQGIATYRRFRRFEVTTGEKLK